MTLGATNVFARNHGERARHGGAPDGCQGSVGAEHISELGDALNGVGAITIIINAAELVAVQTARSARPHTRNVRGC